MEGKGNRDDFSEPSSGKKKKQSNKSFFLVCEPCNYHGEKNEIACKVCGDTMYKRSGNGRLQKNGTFKI